VLQNNMIIGPIALDFLMWMYIWNLHCKEASNHVKVGCWQWKILLGQLLCIDVKGAVDQQATLLVQFTMIYLTM